MQRASCLVAMTLALAVSGQAQDWLAVAGRPGSALADGRVEWLQPAAGTVVALILDPAGSLLAGDSHRIVLGEPLAGDAASAPTLEVREVLPAAWAEPAVWSRRARSPSAFAGQRMSAGRGTFAGIPASDRRAGLQEDGRAEPPHAAATWPVGLGPVSIDVARGGLQFQASAPLQRAVTLLRASAPQGPFSVVGEATAAGDGVVTFVAALRGDAAFYKLELR